MGETTRKPCILCGVSILHRSERTTAWTTRSHGPAHFRCYLMALRESVGPRDKAANYDGDLAPDVEPIP